MIQNPHSPTIIDECSGIEVPNQRWRDWMDGYQARGQDAPLAGGIEKYLLSDEQTDRVRRVWRRLCI